MEGLIHEGYGWLVGAVGVAVALYIGKVALLLLAALKVKVKAMQAGFVRDILLNLVKAAEAAIKTEGAGPERKELVQEAAKAAGVNATSLDIEAAVHAMKNE